MTRLAEVLIGPASSTGSPITFMMRPRVSSPTGTAIAAPVSVTSWPRTKPSVASMATVRTVLSPKCWATSSTKRLPRFWVSSALRISGRCPSNWTSTTAPVTWRIRPTVLLAIALLHPSLSSKRLGAGDDFNEFLSDVGLPLPVVAQRQFLDHVAGIARGAVHGAHARPLFGGGILQQAAENLAGDIARHQLAQDFIFAWLVLVNRLLAAGGRFRGALRKLRRNDLQRRRLLRDDRLELGKIHGGDVKLAGFEHGQHFVGDPGGGVEADLLEAAQVDAIDDLATIGAAQIVGALATDGKDFHGLAGGHQPLRVLARQLGDIRVEAAAQPTLGGHHDQQMHIVLAGPDQETGRVFLVGAPIEVGEQAVHALRIGTRGRRRLLGPAQLGGGHHLHGLGDLARRLDRGDTIAEVFEAWHGPASGRAMP